MSQCYIAPLYVVHFKGGLNSGQAQGLGAALLLVSSAHAQQDMDPAFFPDGGNVEPFRQPAPVTVNNAITIDPANAATAQQAISKASTQIGSVVAMWTTANVWRISLLVISMTLVILYSLARAKKLRTKRRSAIGAPTTSGAA